MALTKFLFIVFFCTISQVYSQQFEPTYPSGHRYPRGSSPEIRIIDPRSGKIQEPEYPMKWPRRSNPSVAEPERNYNPEVPAATRGSPTVVYLPQPEPSQTYYKKIGDTFTGYADWADSYGKPFGIEMTPLGKFYRSIAKKYYDKAKDS